MAGGTIRCGRTYNQLDGISKRRIHQTTKGLTELGGELLGGETQKGGERDDCDEVEDENDGRVPGQGAGDDADGDKDEQDVDIVAGQSGVDEMQDVLGQRLDARLVCVVLGAADERGVLIVKAAISRLGHGRLLGVTGGATVAVEVSLYVFCQGRGVSGAVCANGRRSARGRQVGDSALLGMRRSGG